MVAYFDTLKEVWVDIPVGPASITYQQFVTHARRFETTCVVETATEMRLPPTQISRLRVECDQLDREAKANRWKPKRRRTVDETLDAVRLLRAEGLGVSVIADRLGVSDLHVQRCVRTLEKGACKPHGYAAEKHLNAEPRVTVHLGAA